MRDIKAVAMDQAPVRMYRPPELDG
jgi:hypothetical protein